MTPAQRSALARSLAKAANNTSDSTLRSTLQQAASSLAYKIRNLRPNRCGRPPPRSIALPERNGAIQTRLHPERTRIAQGERVGAEQPIAGDAAQ